jgi:uncharacterized protein
VPRPRRKRSIYRPPLFASFKPAGVRGAGLERLELGLDEFEAIRLADYMGLDHLESAEQMNISRSTFSRLVERARHKVAQFLVEGRHLRIEGGDVHFQGNLIRCRGCGQLFQQALDIELDRCPGCGSTDLVDLAGGFGHGACCHRHHRYRRR